MITFAEARRIVQAATPTTRIVLRPLRDALGLALATDIKALEEVPLFVSSAMDGYALRSEDLRGAGNSSPVRLDLDGLAQAGGPPTARVRPNTAVRIFTGAMIPVGADAVIMQEDVHANGTSVQCMRPVEAGTNIRPRGEEYREGDTVFLRGTLITPAVAGMLSTLGHARVHVYARPTVALVVTGNELCDPSEKLRPGQIRDANTYALQAALRSMGIEPTVVRSKDNADALYQTMQIILRRHDIVITSGGVSVGDYDHVRGVLKRLRVHERFWRIAIKPGKPVYFGTRGMRMVFGLPGNPVSALLAMYLFVRPSLALCSGAPVPQPWRQRVRLGCDISKKPGRDEFLRMRLTGESDDAPVALPLSGQGSHMLGGLAAADAFLRCPAEADFIAKGSMVDVERIRWSML